MQKNSVEVQALQRALDILEVIGNSSSPVTLKNITAMVDLPKSTVYRLLSNLESRGYVRCGNDGRYTLGLKLLMMSQRMEQGFELKHVARPYMVKLNELSKESVHLGVLNNNKVLYVDTIDSPQVIRLVAEVGSTNAVHCTALGKALLIGHSDDAIKQVLHDAGMEKRTPYTLVTPESFLAEMQIVRAQGYALDVCESNEHCCCVSAPIYNHHGDVVAAISISGPASRVSRDLMKNELAPKLKEATQAISQFLGLFPNRN